MRTGGAGRSRLPLELREGIAAAIAGEFVTLAVLVEREPGVAFGQIREPALVAALGVADLDPAAAPLAEELREGLALDRRRHQHQRGDGDRERVVLDGELLDHDGQVVLAREIEVKRLAVLHDPVTHLQAPVRSPRPRRSRRR